MKRTVLKRKTGLSPKRTKRRRSSRVHNDEFLAFVRVQLCSVQQEWPKSETCGWEQFSSPHMPAFACEGRIDPDHDSRGRGYGQKSSDTLAIPICRKHHRHRTDRNGVFRYMTKEEMHAWVDRAQARTRANWLEHTGKADW